MGVGGSKEKLLAALPDTGERYFGLENFGNTCYANSVLQALYCCRPFRERLLRCAAEGDKSAGETMLTCLGDLFSQIASQKKQTGVVSPKRFIQKLKRDKEQFRSYDEHQDAHELLLDLLNDCSELLEAEQKSRAGTPGATPSAAGVPRTVDGAAPRKGEAPPSGVPMPSMRTWVHDMFQGREVHETRCLRCETVTTNETDFFALSLAVTQNSSLTQALKSFSDTETLQGNDKFFCNECGTYQEAAKRTRLAALPEVLILHLNRFKFSTMQDRDGYMRLLRSKLMYRVAFPFDLKLGAAAAETCPAADALYTLLAVIVHVGSGLDHGHYVALVKSQGVWLLYEDDRVEVVGTNTVQSVFGSTQAGHSFLLPYTDPVDASYTPMEYGSNMGHGYILLYNRGEESPDLAAPGMRTSQS